MQDKLKQFVEEHREEFEIYQPREYLWEGVNERLQRGRTGVLWKRLALAASILLAITCGTWIIESRHNTPTSETAVQSQPPITEAEAYFTALVQMKDAELGQYCGHQPDLCREFARDIETLANAYQQLKKEYAVSADKQAILRAMTANLQMQVQLINQQLQIMEAVKQKKSEAKII